MIVGIGVDIAEIVRFERAWERFGQRFAERILAANEIAALPRAKNVARYLAMRFAAKEATSKALGTGFKQGIAPRQIELHHAPSGKPDIVVHGNADKMFRAMNIAASHVSLSDDGGFAIAYVVLERADLPDKRT